MNKEIASELISLYSNTVNDNKEDFLSIMQIIAKLCYYLKCKNIITDKEMTDILQIKEISNANLVDLGVKDNEPIGFKFDTSINKPVLAKRCDDYYYAYPSLIGWTYYRSRYLDDRDKEIIDIDFDSWAHELTDVLYQEYKNTLQKVLNEEKQEIINFLENEIDNGKKVQKYLYEKENTKLIDKVKINSTINTYQNVIDFINKGNN